VTTKRNELTQERFERQLATRPGFLASAIAAGPDARGEASHNERVADAYLTLAASLHATGGDPSAAAANLAAAAEYGVRYLASVAESTRLPLGAARTAALVAAFGPATLRSRLAAIATDAFAHPEFPLLTRAAGLLRGRVGTGTLDRAEAEAIALACRAGNASRLDAQLTLSIAAALLAIEDGDGAGLRDALQLGLGWHESEAREGDLRFSYHGVLAEIALGLVALGRERGLDVDPASPYVPLSLLPARS
jgi:hypothetical protein